jgi:hypothetical protein
MSSLLQFTFPTQVQLDALIHPQKDAELTYNKYKLTGFNNDKNEIFLGNSANVLASTKFVMSERAMFFDGWTHIYYQNPTCTGGILWRCVHVLWVPQCVSYFVY